MAGKDTALPLEPFVAIDFETADYGRDSACSVALVRVDHGRVVASANRLIRPPRRDFMFTGIHGITWRDVQREPVFADVWAAVSPLLEGATALVAHNASFDKSVLNACCLAAGMEAPPLPFACTVRIARSTWGLTVAKLDVVCAHLGIPLQHHDALSDASACARIVLEARRHSIHAAPEA